MRGPRAGPAREHTEDGFTLIELLVVIIIIAILAAIAIPIFMSHKARSYDAAAKSDLQQLATQEETYLGDSGSYGPIASIPAFRPTADVTVAVVLYDGERGYCLTAQHAGSTKLWVWDSKANGLQPEGTAACPLTTSGTPGDMVTG